MSIDVSKEVLSPPGMLESGGEKLMKLFIVGIEGIDFILKIVFNSFKLILVFFEVSSFSFDGFELEQMLFVLHFDYTGELC